MRNMIWPKGYCGEIFKKMQFQIWVFQGFERYWKVYKSNNIKMFSTLDLAKYWWDKNILVSLIFSKLKTFFEWKDKIILFEHIKSIKISNDHVFIKTIKPIVNSELKFHEEEIEKIILDLFRTFGLHYKRLKIMFK